MKKIFTIIVISGLVGAALFMFGATSQAAPLPTGGQFPVGFGGTNYSAAQIVHMNAPGVSSPSYTAWSYLDPQSRVLMIKSFSLWNMPASSIPASGARIVIQRTGPGTPGPVTVLWNGDATALVDVPNDNRTGIVFPVPLAVPAGYTVRLEDALGGTFPVPFQQLSGWVMDSCAAGN